MNNPNGMILELDVSEDTAADLQELAEIVRGDQEDPLALLAQDAFRTYAWVLRQQATERIVVSVSTETMNYLRDLEKVPGGPARTIPQFVPTDFVERVRKFFGI